MYGGLRTFLLVGGIITCIIGTFLLILNITSSWVGSKRNPGTDVKNLESMLLVLELHHVEDFRNQDWCKNLVYMHGKFSAYSGTVGTCNLFPGEPRPFDTKATKDFNSIAEVLATTEVPVLWISSRFTEAGTISYAEFQLDCFFCRTSYVYEPHFGQLPSSVETRYTKITDNWYEVDEDWN